MAIAKPSAGGAKQAPKAPKAEAKKAPKNEPKKPQDNKAAKEAPKETRAAAKNAFGDVPKNGGAKQADQAPKSDGAKQSGDAPKNNDTPKAPDNDAKQSEAAPKEATTPPDGDAKAAPAPENAKTAPAADGKTAPTDAKTAPPDGGGKTPTLVVTNPVGNPAAPKTNNLVTENPPPDTAGDGKAPPANDAKAAPVPDPKAAPAAADPKAAPATDPTNPIVVTSQPAPKAALADDPKAAPAADPKTSPGTDAKAPLPPVDPKVQEILDTKLPDGKTVKEKIDADTPDYLLKSAKDHYNAQKDKGEPFDAVSAWYQNNTAKAITEKGIPDAKITADSAKDLFDIDKINQNIEDAAKDPAFGNWVTEQQANSVENTIASNPDIAKLVEPYKQQGENYVNALRRMQSDYMSDPKFADAVAKAKSPEEAKALVNEGFKTLAGLGLGEEEMLGVNNKLAENVRAKYTPDAPKTVIDPNTNKAVATEDGYNLATLPNGTGIALGTDGKAIADMQGNAYVYSADGTAKVDANSKYVQYDAKAKASYANYNGTKYMIGDDGNGKFDAQGRPLAIDNDGSAPVALDKEGKAVTDLAGNKLVFDPTIGKAVTDPDTGNAVVIDPDTKAVVQTDVGGKVIAGKNGDPYAVDQQTGKFVQDAQGRYVQISKENVAPGILPGYVVDKNNIKMVVSPTDGKPMVDPATGKTVILDPKTNAPQLVPLDAKGKPQITEDGKSIVYNETGNTVVPNEGKGPDWLVAPDGKYAQNASGNYIGVNARNGLAAPVDENGFIKNGNGLTPLWDTKANATMTTKDGNQVVIDDQGNLLQANAQEQTVVEEKSGLPIVIDPKTNAPMVNPDTGRTILAEQGGALVEYNADDGYKYLINPETKTTVKTAEGNPVVTSADGLPYAVTPDGTVVKNPATGNAIVYGTDGKQAVEASTGFNIEITSSGKAHVIDPKTNAPMAERDPKTGGYQIFNTDGTGTTNPDTGNKIQMVPDSGLKVEIDAKTNKPVTDVKGNPLVMGADNRPLKTPDGNTVVADLKTGVPVAADADGKLIVDPVSKLPQAVNAETGMPLADPDTKAAVVVDPKSRQPVQVDANGKIVTDPVTGIPVAINTKTGAQVKGPDGELAVKDPGTGLPVYYDKESKLFTVTDPDTNKAVTSPKTGAKTVVDLGSGLIFDVLPDAQGNHIIVDENGQPVKADNGKQPWFDKNTGKMVIVNDKGEAVDPTTGKKPEAFDPKDLVYATPLLMAPPAVAVLGTGSSNYPAYPQPVHTYDRNALNNVIDQHTYPYGSSSSAPGNDNGTGVGSGEFPAPKYPSPAKYTYPWEAPGYKMTPAERAAFINQWNNDPDMRDMMGFLFDTDKTTIQDIEAGEEIKKLRDYYPGLENIPSAEIVAIRAYTDGTGPFREMNKAMYTHDAALLQRHELFIKTLRSGLTHLAEAGYIYTGPSTRFLSLGKTKFMELFQEGGMYTNPQFMSATTHTGGYQLLATMDGLRGANGGKLDTTLKVIHTSAVDIAPAAMFPGAKEVIGLPGVKYSVSNVKPAGSRGGLGSLFLPRKFGKATLTEISPNGGLPGGNPDFSIPGGSKALNWAKLGKVLGMAGGAADAIFGGVQIVTGGMAIAEGIKNKDNYGIATGSLDVGSGALALGSTAAWLAGGTAAAAVAPLAGAAAVVGMVALIVDILKHQDDHKKFANSLGEQFEPFGILKDGWREKAAQTYYDSQGEPDPAPIAHNYF